MKRREFIIVAGTAGVSMLACGLARAAAPALDGERKACPNKELNNKRCPCTNTDCENHGICCQCVMNHRTQKNKPACLR